MYIQLTINLVGQEHEKIVLLIKLRIKIMAQTYQNMALILLNICLKKYHNAHLKGKVHEPPKFALIKTDLKTFNS